MVRNQTEAAYARSDLFARRRRLMDDWLAYLDGECRADTGPGSDPYTGHVAVRLRGTSEAHDLERQQQQTGTARITEQLEDADRVNG